MAGKTFEGWISLRARNKGGLAFAPVVVIHSKSYIDMTSLPANWVGARTMPELEPLLTDYVERYGAVITMPQPLKATIVWKKNYLVGGKGKRWMIVSANFTSVSQSDVLQTAKIEYDDPPDLVYKLYLILPNMSRTLSTVLPVLPTKTLIRYLGAEHEGYLPLELVASKMGSGAVDVDILDRHFLVVNPENPPVIEADNVETLRGYVSEGQIIISNLGYKSSILESMLKTAQSTQPPAPETKQDFEEGLG